MFEETARSNSTCWNRNRSRSNLRPAIYYGESDIHQANVWVRDYDGNTGVTLINENTILVIVPIVEMANQITATL
jgi:hypothetical protein